MATGLDALTRAPRIVAAIVALCTLLASPALHAELEIISLRHRTVEQVLPILRPLIEPGGVLSGQGNQLIVRTSPHNLAELRKVLAAVDRPLRRLSIAVRFDTLESGASRSIGVEGTVRSGDVAVTTRPRAADRSEVEIRAQERRVTSEERVDQRLQVLEGGEAFIAAGESRPVRQRQVVQTPTGTLVTETTTLQEARTGFYVVPRLAGDQVMLEIAPQRETFVDSRAGGAPAPMQVQRVSTTVSGRLGEWIELGGAGGEADRAQTGLLSGATVRSRDQRRVWVKVDEVSP